MRREMQKTRVGLAVLGSILLFGCASSSKDFSALTRDGLESRMGVNIRDAFMASKPGLPPGVKLDQPLTSDQAATISLWNNPQFGADLATLGIAKGDLLDAGQIRNPRLDLLFPLGLKPFELLLNLPIEAIWERPARVAAAEKTYEQLANSLIQNGLVAVQDAQIAHANLVLAKKREEILYKASELRKRIAKINREVRVRAGELTEVEGIATEVDSATSVELWVRAKHDTLLATERFRQSTGLMYYPGKIDVAPSSSVLSQPLPADVLVEKALIARPDLRAAELAILAAAKRADWESARIAQLSLLLNSKGIGDHGILTGPGVSLELPIFHQNNGRRTRADAEVEVATLQYLALKQRVAFEVKESRELLVQAQEVLSRTRDNVLPLVNRTVILAERQYKRGAAAYLFVLEQTRNLVDAQLRAADFEAAVARAEAQLRRAIGGGK